MRGSYTNHVLDMALLVLIGHYLVTAPFSKVEESFNMQAIHDITYYGVLDTAKFDHSAFPGVVPRTFLTALVVSFPTFLYKTLVRPFVEHTGASLDIQMAARALIGLANAGSMIFFKNAVKDATSKGTWANWYSILQYCQFHVLFYASRTLPNFMALPVTNVAFALLAKGNYTSCLHLLSFCGIVFRAEIGLLAVATFVTVTLFVPAKDNGFIATTALQVMSMVFGVLVGAVTSLLVDSYFWGYWTIPELQSVYFNLVEGKSELWGVEPFWAYFTKYIPNIFTVPVVLLLLLPGFFYKPETARKTPHLFKIFLTISVLYVLGISFQPHKEWRFIVYVIPLLTAVGANGAYGFTASQTLMKKFLSLFIVALAVANLGGSLLAGYISSINYPGGVALQKFNTHIIQKMNTDNRHELAQHSEANPAVVHFDVYTAMTGASLFGQIHDVTVVYDKSETSDDLFVRWPTFDYLIMEAPLETSGLLTKDTWRQVDSVWGYSHTSVLPILQEIISWGDNKRIPVAELWESAQRWESWVSLLESIVVQKELVFIYERTQEDEFGVAERAQHLKMIKETLDKAQAVDV